MNTVMLEYIRKLHKLSLSSTDWYDFSIQALNITDEAAEDNRVSVYVYETLLRLEWEIEKNKMRKAGIN